MAAGWTRPWRGRQYSAPARRTIWAFSAKSICDSTIRGYGSCRSVAAGGMRAVQNSVMRIWRRARRKAPPSSPSSTRRIRVSSRPAICPPRSRSFAGRRANGFRRGRVKSRALCWRVSALRYRYSAEVLSRLSGVRFETMRLMGGGARNALLCQMSADALGASGPRWPDGGFDDWKYDPTGTRDRHVGVARAGL